MTQPITARSAAAPTAPATTAPTAIPAQRAAEPTAPGCPAAAPAPDQPTGWAALRRNLAIVRGLRSLATVPARPQASYGECDGH